MLFPPTGKAMQEVKTPKTKQNLIDRIVSAINPEAGLRRIKARTIISAYEKSAYNGASRSRAAIGSYSPVDGDANDDTLPDLPVLRSRSRDTVRNNPIAGGALQTLVTNVVGTGLTMRANINGAALGLTGAEAGIWQDDVNARFEAWAESPDCDAARGMNFYSLQALAFRSMLESGDIFVVPVRVDYSPQMALQLIEADRVRNKDDVRDTDKLIAGIQINNYGAPVRYHICNQHPSQWNSQEKREWVTLPAFGQQTGRRNVIHLCERRRPGQLRGVPIFAPVIEPLKQLQRYTEAELQAAVVSGAFAVFLKMDPNAFADLFDDNGKAQYMDSATKWNGSFPASGMDGPGKVVNLLPGEEPIDSNPGRPNSEFDPFCQAILRQIGCELGLPFEVLIKHFTSSYSAARAALLDAWRTFRCRREFLAAYLCQPVYEDWLTREIADGRIIARGFFEDAMIRRAWCAANWIGDGPGSIDPQREVQAARDRIDLGISTIADESILWDGRDWWEKHKQRSREKSLRVGAGLESSLSTPTQYATPQPQAG